MREPDIGSDATLTGTGDDVPPTTHDVPPTARTHPASRGSDVPTIASRSPRMSGTHAASSLVRTLTLAPADLPADLDRSTLTPAERALTVSRYILLSRLGAGGMGLVFLAYDPALGRKVALKLLRPGGDREPAAEAHARLHREAMALAKLSHPNVVAVYDVGTYDARALYGADDGEPGDGVFIVMEYIEGITLAHWLDERPRPWREVLAVFLAAGRGLAAAHAVGILHRDFKPSNVLLKQDGSVHVFDFGLARAAHDLPDVLAAEVPTPSTTASVSLASPLTQRGAVLGTPVYMAPEQRGGEDVDERCDQFSFCVALYEGLYATRPFSGENFYALEVAKLAGTIDPPKRPVTVPKRLRRAVLRGLAGAPADRWPNLATLLLELGRVHDPRRGRRFAVAGLLLGLSVGVTAVAATREPLCTGAAAAFGDAWDPRHAPILERTFAGTGLPYARDTWQRTRERLDRHAVAWLAMHRDACVATNIDRTQSPERIDLRMRCLEHARAELAALVVVFASADPEVVANAVAAVTALTPISACEDPDAAPPAPPEDAQLTRAAAEQHAGHHQASHDLAAASLASAAARGDRATVAAAGDALGQALADLSEFAAAEQAITRAYFDAVATDRDVLALAAATDLVSLLGDRLARPVDGHAWARHAEALLDRLGRPPAGEAAYLHNLANLHARSGEYAEAEPLYRRALARLPADAPLQRALMLTSLASTIAYLGRTDQSIALYSDALAIREATLGADHPLVAQTLFNLGGSYALLGDNARNEAVQRRALAIWRASLPPRHELLAYPLAALGDITLERADYPAALAQFDEARAIWEANFGPAYPTVASMHERMATTRLMQGDVAAARVLCDRSVDLWTRSGAPEPLQLAMALIVRSQIAQADGDLAAARTYGERARDTTAKDFGADNLYTLAARLQLVVVDLDAAERRHAGPSDPGLVAAIAEVDTILAVTEREHGRDARWLVEPLVAAARAYRIAGRSADARTALARAAPIADANKLVAGRADIDLALALATWELDRPRAHNLATSALAVYRTIGARRSAAEAEQWLAEHSLP